MAPMHGCKIKWLTVPTVETTTHVIPQLKQQELLSVVKMFDAGYELTLKHECCIISHKQNHLRSKNSMHRSVVSTTITA